MNEVCKLFELLTENRPAGHQPIVFFLSNISRFGCLYALVCSFRSWLLSLLALKWTVFTRFRLTKCFQRYLLHTYRLCMSQPCCKNVAAFLITIRDLMGNGSDVWLLPDIGWYLFPNLGYFQHAANFLRHCWNCTVLCIRIIWFRIWPSSFRHLAPYFRFLMIRYNTSEQICHPGAKAARYRAIKK